MASTPAPSPSTVPQPSAAETSAALPDGTAHPVTPVGGISIEARTAEFTWTHVPEATEYHLQIAPEADFADTYFDASVGNATTLSVYDVLPEDGSTCYWRVRGIRPEGPTDWGGVAHFVASPDPIVEQANTSLHQDADTTGVPQPTHPTDGAPVDGRSATFEWASLTGADGYEVQVAPTRNFEQIVANVPVRNTTMLTIYAMLPEDGSTFYWRVRGIRQNGSLTDWSDPATFDAATDEDVLDFEAEQERLAEAEAEQRVIERAETAAARAEAESPVLTAQTSPTFAYTVAYLAILTFAATVYLVATVA